MTTQLTFDFSVPAADDDEGPGPFDDPEWVMKQFGWTHERWRRTFRPTEEETRCAGCRHLEREHRLPPRSGPLECTRCDCRDYYLAPAAKGTPSAGPSEGG